MKFRIVAFVFALCYVSVSEGEGRICRGILSKRVCRQISNAAKLLGNTVEALHYTIEDAMVDSTREICDVYQTSLRTLGNRFVDDFPEDGGYGTEDLIRKLIEMLRRIIQETKIQSRMAVRESLDALTIADFRSRAILEKTILNGSPLAIRRRFHMEKSLEKIFLISNGDSEHGEMGRREADDIDKIPLWEAQKQLLELFKPAQETNENAIKAIQDYINKEEQNFMKSWWQKRHAGKMEHREADDIDKIPLWEAQKQLLELFKPAHETNENAIKSIKDYINKQEQNFMKNWWQKRNAVLNHREADELNITIPSKAHEELLKILRSALAANEKNLQTVLNYIGQDNSGFSRKWHEVMEGIPHKRSADDLLQIAAMKKLQRRSQGCSHKGKFYEIGETRSADCNTCFCGGNDMWACTLMGCLPLPVEASFPKGRLHRRNADDQLQKFLGQAHKDLSTIKKLALTQYEKSYRDIRDKIEKEMTSFFGGEQKKRLDQTTDAINEYSDKIIKQILGKLENIPDDKTLKQFDQAVKETERVLRQIETETTSKRSKRDAEKKRNEAMELFKTMVKEEVNKAIKKIYWRYQHSDVIEAVKKNGPAFADAITDSFKRFNEKQLIS